MGIKNMKVNVLVAQSCPILCDSMDCSLPSSSVHGILQAKMLEWVAIPFSWGSFRPRDQTWVSCRLILYHLSQNHAILVRVRVGDWVQGHFPWAQLLHTSVYLAVPFWGLTGMSKQICWFFSLEADAFSKHFHFIRWSHYPPSYLGPSAETILDFLFLSLPKLIWQALPVWLQVHPLLHQYLLFQVIVISNLM